MILSRDSLCLNPPPGHFIAHTLHRARLDATVTFATLHLQHLKAHFPAAEGSFGHRLFIQHSRWLPRLFVVTLIPTSHGVLLARVCSRFPQAQCSLPFLLLTPPHLRTALAVQDLRVWDLDAALLQVLVSHGGLHDCLQFFIPPLLTRRHPESHVD